MKSRVDDSDKGQIQIAEIINQTHQDAPVNKLNFSLGCTELLIYYSLCYNTKCCRVKSLFQKL